MPLGGFELPQSTIQVATLTIQVLTTYPYTNLFKI